MVRSSPEPTTHRTLRPTLCADLSDRPSPIALSARAREQSSLQAACNLHEKMSRDFHSGAQGDPLQPVWPPCLFCRLVARRLPCLLPGADRHIPFPGTGPASGILTHPHPLFLISAPFLSSLHPPPAHLHDDSFWPPVSFLALTPRLQSCV